MSDLPELALEVHGGVRRWRETPSLEARFIRPAK
jgi:hypothetical protein